MRIYLRAGLYAEGPTDYYFLAPLIDRLLDALGAELFPANYDVATTIGIDSTSTQGGRAYKIADAIEAYFDECTLFVVHADGGGDPVRAYEHNVAPAVAVTRARLPDATPVVGCVPIRETEAWMLVDSDVFRALLGSNVAVDCEMDAEGHSDPKATLRGIFNRAKSLRRPRVPYAFFGEQVRFDSLRRLPAFREFENRLRDVVTQIAARPTFK